jgi:hypothetical protein
MKRSNVACDTCYEIAYLSNFKSIYKRITPVNRDFKGQKFRQKNFKFNNYISGGQQSRSFRDKLETKSYENVAIYIQLNLIISFIGSYAGDDI